VATTPDRRPVALAVLALALATSPGAAQSPAPSAIPSKSVRGTLDKVEVGLRAVAMRTDDGKRLAWKFNAEVIAELARFEKGAPMIVIYRQTSASEKRVTAVAFPGTAEKPTYVNLTGERVSIRSAAAADGVCTQYATSDFAADETAIPPGGRAEIPEGCWCCALAGERCTPTTRSGKGVAFLERCF
jgi:hypothetical protein